MTAPDPDDPTPDSAMGSDSGERGGHLGPGDLSPSEERLLAALERDVERPLTDGTDVVEVRAAEEERPLPARGGPPDDGLVPRFEAPDGI